MERLKSTPEIHTGGEYDPVKRYLKWLGTKRFFNERLFRLRLKRQCIPEPSSPRKSCTKKHRDPIGKRLWRERVSAGTLPINLWPPVTSARQSLNDVDDVWTRTRIGPAARCVGVRFVCVGPKAGATPTTECPFFIFRRLPRAITFRYLLFQLPLERRSPPVWFPYETPLSSEDAAGSIPRPPVVWPERKPRRIRPPAHFRSLWTWPYYVVRFWDVCRMPNPISLNVSSANRIERDENRLKTKSRLGRGKFGGPCTSFRCRMYYVL